MGLIIRSKVFVLKIAQYKQPSFGILSRIVFAQVLCQLTLSCVLSQ